MFDIAPTELLLLGAVAIIVIPPKDLPKAMRVAGYWVGRARGAARQFRAGFDNIIRESELQEMEKRWAEENERIMREHPPTPAMLALDSPAETHSWPDIDGEAPVVTVTPPVSAPAVDDNGVLQAPPVPTPAPAVKKAPAKAAKTTTVRKAPARKAAAKDSEASS